MMNTSLLFFILFSITLKKKLREAEEPKSVAIKQKEAYISKSQFLNIRYKSTKLSNRISGGTSVQALEKLGFTKFTYIWIWIRMVLGESLSNKTKVLMGMTLVPTEKK